MAVCDASAITDPGTGCLVSDNCGNLNALRPSGSGTGAAYQGATLRLLSGAWSVSPSAAA
jgi:hypothetical protein